MWSFPVLLSFPLLVSLPTLITIFLYVTFKSSSQRSFPASQPSPEAHPFPPILDTYEISFKPEVFYHLEWQQYSMYVHHPSAGALRYQLTIFPYQRADLSRTTKNLLQHTSCCIFPIHSIESCGLSQISSPFGDTTPQHHTTD